ncbi:hypothetical protein [Bifidobacterium apri]|uniref:PhnA protein n=1 Tax=Bifidobacterium apri TaxID=1769423 RepID=A0A6A2VD54_9BIFI|nr:hypothetical protein [Bifidobacterium apri]KAB8292070.1 hypothetical protein DSM100238_1814 [Bifidobacterium apri]
MTDVPAAYDTCASCWREATPDDYPAYMRDHPNLNKPTICASCWTRLVTDLEWMTRNLDSLEEYRINRANGRHDGNGGGGNRGNAPTPVRERIYDLLFEKSGTGAPGVRLTLTAYLDCLGQRYMHGDKLSVLAHRVASCPLLLANNTASGVYAREIHRLTRQCQACMTGENSDTIILGPCPAKDCGTILTAPDDAVTVTCPHCRNTIPVSLMRIMQRQRILNSPVTGTARQLRRTLQDSGIRVNANTMYSWIHRGVLRPAKHQPGKGKPVYRLCDVYALATRAQQQQQAEEGETE